MVVLVTCKNEEDPIKNKGARVFTTLNVDFSDAQGQITQESVMRSGQNCEWSQHCSHYYKSMRIFQDAQGQLTPQSMVGFGRISNSSTLLWLPSLPARMNKIRSKMKVLEFGQNFLHYNFMVAICCHGNQSSDPICAKT